MLRFDTNPLNLRNPTTEAVATFRDLMRDAETTPNTIQILAPDLGAAQALAARLDALPEVSGTRTLADFVPQDQDGQAGADPRHGGVAGPDPRAAGHRAAARRRGHGARARRRLGHAPPRRAGRAGRGHAGGARVAGSAPHSGAWPKDHAAARDRLDAALVPGLVTTLEGLRLALDARPVTVADLPDSLRRDWLTPDGRARVEVRPRDLSDRSDAMARFARAVLAVAPAPAARPSPSRPARAPSAMPSCGPGSSPLR